MDFTQARHNMVEGQVRTNRVTDPLVVQAMEELPREDFLPPALKARAYIDEDIVVAPGRILMEPMVMARLLQAADVQNTDMAMVVASATGFEAAVMARLAGAVVALEPNTELAAASEAALGTHQVDTVSVLRAALVSGHPAQAPFDVIFINGAVDEVPQSLVDQLGEGGRLVCVVAPAGARVGEATLVLKANGVASSRVVFDAAVPVLPEFSKTPSFKF